MDSQSIYRRRWVILSVLIVGLLAIVIDNTVLNVAMKTIAEPRGGLGASQSQLEWAINSYTLVFAGLLFTFGVIGDKVGRKRMLMIGLALFGIASLLSAYAQTPEQLIFARAAMGLGGAAVMPQTLSIISNVFEPAERPRAIGMWATRGRHRHRHRPGARRPAARPLLVGFGLPDQRAGDRRGHRSPRRSWCRSPATARPAGSTTWACCCPSRAWCCWCTASSQGGDSASWLHLGVLGPIVGGLAVLAVFAWYEARIQHPSLDVRLFRDRRLSASIGSLGLVFFGMGGVFFFTSFYLQNVRGYTPLAAGLLTVPFAAGQLLMSPRSARMVQRYGAKAVGATGMFVMAAAHRGLRHPRHRDADLDARGAVRHPGRGDRREHAGRDRRGDGRAAARAGRRRLGADQHRPPGRGRAQRRHPRLDPGPVLPERAQPVADRACRPRPASAASSSITATQAVAQQLGAAGRSLLGPANDAFVSSMRITTLIAAVLALAGGFVVLRWMPGKPAKADRAGRWPALRPLLRGRACHTGRAAHARELTARGVTPHAARDPGPGAHSALTRGRAGGTTRRPGRPRSEQAEQAIIEATLDLFAEQGFEGVCVEAVAARAGVGKATIYRRWPSKEELLLAALGSMKSPFPEPVGNVREDLVAQLT